MTATDMLLLAIIGISMLLGVMRGFIGVLASLAAWVLAAWASFQFGAQVALLLSRGYEPSSGQMFAGYGLSFLFVLLVVGIVGWLVRKLVPAIGLSGMVRGQGFMRGLVGDGLVALLRGVF